MFSMPEEIYPTVLPYGTAAPSGGGELAQRGRAPLWRRDDACAQEVRKRDPDRWAVWGFELWLLIIAGHKLLCPSPNTRYGCC